MRPPVLAARRSREAQRDTRFGAVVDHDEVGAFRFGPHVRRRLLESGAMCKSRTRVSTHT